MAEFKYKSLTKEDINEILSTYSTRKKEFKPYFQNCYLNNRIKGYMITITEETDHLDGTLTGRYIVHHTQEDGKISFIDTWCKDKNGRLFFLARNLANEPLSDFEVYKELEQKIEICKKAFQDALEEQISGSGDEPEQKMAMLEKKLAYWEHYANRIECEYQKLINDRNENFENSSLYQSMKKNLQELTDENNELKLNSSTCNSTPVHNTRGAGRKMHDETWQNSVMQFGQLYSKGYSKNEIMGKMNISHATYYRYKREIEKLNIK